VAALRDFGLAYDILIYPRHLPAAVEFAQRLEGHRLVLDHLAKPDIRRGEIAEWRRHLRALAACGHVMAKISGLVTEADWHKWTADGMRPYLDAAFECFGWERLMIGSDWPVCTVAADYGRTMRLVTDYVRERPAREQDAVLGGNAARLWQLDAKENQA
jgi:L-fuconolactonase